MAFDIERIKREARDARRKHGVAPTQYLNQFARQQGFHTWESLVVHQGNARAVTSKARQAPATMHPLRKLLVLGVNELLAKGHISLAGGNEKTSHLFATLAGRPSVILWNGIGHDELRVSVWWDYNHAKHPQANLAGAYREMFVTSEPVAKPYTYPRFMGAMASGWLERLSGKHLMGVGAEYIFDTYMRRADRQTLEALSNPVPAGFGAEGKFIF